MQIETKFIEDILIIKPSGLSNTLIKNKQLIDLCVRKTEPNSSKYIVLDFTELESPEDLLLQLDTADYYFDTYFNKNKFVVLIPNPQLKIIIEVVDYVLAEYGVNISVSPNCDDAIDYLINLKSNKMD